MTESQAEQKTKEMTKEVMEYLQKETMRLFNCGGIDSIKFEDNYLLPKILLHVALLNCAEQYRPFTNKSDVNNLKQF